MPAELRHGLALAGITLLLSACGGGHNYHGESSQGSTRADTFVCTPPNIADAVPRNEPVAHYGNPETYKVYGVNYHVMKSSAGYHERGLASWYGPDFHGKRTSSGEQYNMNAMTAAHKTLPLPTYVRVTNLENGRQAVVKVNDRGPFHEDRIIDLSYAAAQKLCVVRNGTARVDVEAIDPDTYTGHLLTATKDAGQNPDSLPPQSSQESGQEQATSANGDTDLDSSAVAIAPIAAGTAVTVLDDAPVPGSDKNQDRPAAGNASTSASTDTYPTDNTPGFAAEGESDSTDDPNLRKVGSPRADQPQSQPATGSPPQEDITLQAPASGTSAATPTTGLFLQAGAFSQQANAQALADRLRKAGLNQVSIRVFDSGDAPIRVRLGPYPDADAMEIDRERLSELGIQARGVRE